jgi:hypothetical protein
MAWVNYVVWAIAILILIWLLIDAFRIETTYDAELLVSSVEGEIEKEILGHDELAHLKDGTRGGA